MIKTSFLDLLQLHFQSHDRVQHARVGAARGAAHGEAGDRVDEAGLLGELAGVVDLVSEIGDDSNGGGG